MSRVLEINDQVSHGPQKIRPARSSPTLIEVRPIAPPDLQPLMQSVGPLVDNLYPAGAAHLQDRLEDALAGDAYAHVVAPKGAGSPIALAAEASKGYRARKLGTFWVSPLWRRRRIGSLLISHRAQSWLSENIDAVHVTVREERSCELLALLSPWGFRSALLVLDRYGEGKNELVLQWRPEYICLGTSLVEGVLHLHGDQREAS